MNRFALTALLCSSIVAQASAVAAQNVKLLPHRECSASGSLPIPGLQPTFGLASSNAEKTGGGLSKVLIRSELPSSSDGVYPWNYLKMVDLVPKTGLIHQSTDVHADLSIGKNIGFAQIEVEPGNYTVVLYVEDNSDFANCDAYFGYSVGTVTVK